MNKFLLSVSVFLALAATSCLDINSGNIDPNVSVFPNTKFPFSFSMDYTFDRDFDTDIPIDTEPLIMEYGLGDNDRLAGYLGDSAAFTDVLLHAAVNNGTGASFILEISACGIGGIEGNDCSSVGILIDAYAKNIPLELGLSDYGRPFSSINKIGLKLRPVAGKALASEKISCSCEYFTTFNGIIFGGRQ